MSTGQPDAVYFEVMAAQARTHWWYESRRHLITQMLGGRVVPGAVVVDVGCGTGDNFAALEAVTTRSVVGAELSPQALRHAPPSRAGCVRVSIARAECLPFASGCADVVTSLDVVEHLDDDVAALREYRRLLRPGGWLLLTVPAYQWLWSHHDEWAAHRRRYGADQLAGAVEAAGLAVDRVTYFNSFLVPPAVLLRRTPLRRLVRGADDEVGTSRPSVHRAMTALAAAERRVARRGRVPFGLSILLLGRVP